jgi:DNA-binding CsgD family transcriptional regulator
MALWKDLLRAMRGADAKELTALPIDDTLLADLDARAEQEQRPRELVVRDLLAFALDQVEANETNLEIWWTLTRREQQVAALACLEYSNREVAKRLKIAPNTVKTHIRNILRKFNLPNRDALRQVLNNWDFSSWE